MENPDTVIVKIMNLGSGYQLFPGVNWVEFSDTEGKPFIHMTFSDSSDKALKLELSGPAYVMSPITGDTLASYNK